VPCGMTLSQYLAYSIGLGFLYYSFWLGGVSLPGAQFIFTNRRKQMENPLAALVSHLHLKDAVKVVPVVSGAAVKGITTVAKEVPKIATDMESVMVHVAKYATVGLDDVQKYTPDAVHIANVLFPEYTLLEDTAGALVVNACGLLKNGILMIQQKYAVTPKTPETNAQKFADAMVTFGPVVMSLLTMAGLNVNDTRVGKAINAIVEMLGANMVPIAPTAPQPVTP